MKLWMSGEIQKDVGDVYRIARKSVEQSVNDRLLHTTLETKTETWAFIAIITPDDHPDYPEIKKKDSRRKVLEFRLKIDHARFLHGTPEQRIEMLLDALKRSVSYMPELGVSQEDCTKLLSLLN